MQALSLGDGQFYTFNVSTKKSDVMVIEQTGDCLETKPLSSSQAVPPRPQHHRGSLGVVRKRANTELCIQLPKGSSLKNKDLPEDIHSTSSYGPSAVVRGGQVGAQLSLTEEQLLRKLMANMEADSTLNFLKVLT